ncbi:hypothetical protein [Lentzea sp. NPDC004782]
MRLSRKAAQACSSVADAMMGIWLEKYMPKIRWRKTERVLRQGRDLA